MSASTKENEKYTQVQKKSHRSPSEDVKKALDIMREHLTKLRPVAGHSATRSEDGRTNNNKSSQTVDRILDAAHTVFTQHGHAGLSLRKVAEKAGLAVGNLTYHFPTKATLITEMLRAALADFVEAHLRQVEKAPDDPLEILLDVVEFYVRNARDEHRFFFQLWGYAGSSDASALEVRELYQPIGRFVFYLVRAANPKLNNEEVQRATLQIFSLEEGYKLFIGLGPTSARAITTAETDIRALTRQVICAGKGL